MRLALSRALGALLNLLACCTLAACSSPASPAAPAAASLPTEALAAPATPSPTSTPSARRTEMPPFPACKGMQKLDEPVVFDWPNLKASMEQFIASAWDYYSCDQPAAEVITLYHEPLGKAPYNLWEANWLEREQGTLGIYFSDSGLWYYVWFLPQPDDPAKSYIVLAESMASVEC